MEHFIINVSRIYNLYIWSPHSCKKSLYPTVFTINSVHRVKWDIWSLKNWGSLLCWHNRETTITGSKYRWVYAPRRFYGGLRYQGSDTLLHLGLSSVAFRHILHICRMWKYKHVFNLVLPKIAISILILIICPEIKKNRIEKGNFWAATHDQKPKYLILVYNIPDIEIYMVPHQLFSYWFLILGNVLSRTLARTIFL
jgi:hypothetical protein